MHALVLQKLFNSLTQCSQLHNYFKDRGELDRLKGNLMIYWGWFAENLGHIKISGDIFGLHRFQELLVPWIGPALPVWEPATGYCTGSHLIGNTCVGCTSATRATQPRGPSLTRPGPFSSSSSRGLPTSGAAPAACPTPPACGWGWRTSSSWGCSSSLSTPSAMHWARTRDWRGGHHPGGNQVPKKLNFSQHWLESNLHKVSASSGGLGEPPPVWGFQKVAPTKDCRHCKSVRMAFHREIRSEKRKELKE